MLKKTVKQSNEAEYGLMDIFMNVKFKQSQMKGIIDGLESLHLFKPALVEITEKIDEIHKSVAEMVEDQQGNKKKVIVKCPSCNKTLEVMI